MSRPNHGPYLADKPNKEGFWEVRWTENRRSRTISTGKTSRQAATIWMAGWLQVHEDAQQELAAPSKPLCVAELMDLYSREYADEHVHDIERMVNASKPIEKFFGAMRPDDIDEGTIATYCRDRRAGKLGRVVQDGTVRRELQHLRTVLIYASRNPKRTFVHPHHLPRIVMPEKSEPRSVVATDDEIDRLMAAAQPDEAETLTRAYRFIAIARWTAARKNSIETLPWSRVDLDAGTIDFREPGRRITQKRRVPVPIAAKLLPILRRAFAEKTGLFVLGETNDIRESFMSAGRRAGVRKEITPHVLRHSWATHAADRGVSAWTIAKMLGDTLATVEENYMHRSQVGLREALDGETVKRATGS